MRCTGQLINVECTLLYISIELIVWELLGAPLVCTIIKYDVVLVHTLVVFSLYVGECVHDTHDQLRLGSTRSGTV